MVRYGQIIGFVPYWERAKDLSIAGGDLQLTLRHEWDRAGTS